LNEDFPANDIVNPVAQDDPLFYKENNRMLFGDARKMLNEVLTALKT